MTIALRVAESIIRSRLPLKRNVSNCSTNLVPELSRLSLAQIQTVPTGFSSDPPPGPAIPLVDIGGTCSR